MASIKIILFLFGEKSLGLSFVMYAVYQLNSWLNDWDGFPRAGSETQWQLELGGNFPINTN